MSVDWLRQGRKSKRAWECWRTNQAFCSLADIKSCLPPPHSSWSKLKTQSDRGFERLEYSPCQPFINLSRRFWTPPANKIIPLKNCIDWLIEKIKRESWRAWEIGGSGDGVMVWKGGMEGLGHKSLPVMLLATMWLMWSPYGWLTKRVMSKRGGQWKSTWNHPWLSLYCNNVRRLW